MHVFMSGAAMDFVSSSLAIRKHSMTTAGRPSRTASSFGISDQQNQRLNILFGHHPLSPLAIPGRQVAPLNHSIS
jgi:hypothetical protein